MGLDSLGYLTQQTKRNAPKKGLPPVLERKERKKSKDELARTFREAVWARDGGCSRATGKVLVRGGTIDGDQLGEVDHSIPRSLAPDRLYDVSNGLLLSKNENRLRKAVCPKDPEHKLFDYSGPDDRGKPQRFVWRDPSGRIIKERIG